MRYPPDWTAQITPTEIDLTAPNASDVSFYFELMSKPMPGAPGDPATLAQLSSKPWPPRFKTNLAFQGLFPYAPASALVWTVTDTVSSTTLQSTWLWAPLGPQSLIVQVTAPASAVSRAMWRLVGTEIFSARLLAAPAGSTPKPTGAPGSAAAATPSAGPPTAATPTQPTQ
jgi:hypothetical protein